MPIELADLIQPPMGLKMGLARIIRNGAVVLIEEYEYVEYSPLMWELLC
jgi:hypothetical protein